MLLGSHLRRSRSRRRSCLQFQVEGLESRSLLTAGLLDSAFGGAGIVTTDVGGSADGSRGIAVQQNDGRIVAVGSSHNGANYDFGVSRYNIDGTLDTLFSGDGKLTTSFGTSNDEAAAVAIQPDGRIVVAGYASNTGFYRNFAVARYNVDGSLDTTFSGDGKQTTAVGTTDSYATSVTIQPDGKIVVAGCSWNGNNFDFAVVRYTTTGNVDLSYTTAIGSGNDYATSVAVQPADGRIVVAGYSNNGSYDDFAVVRYTTAGILDSSFDGDGKVTTSIGTSHARSNGMALQSNGSIVLAGLAYTGSRTQFALARYTASGSLDGSFDGDGKLTTTVGLSDSFATGVAIQGDQKLVVSGFMDNGSNGDFAVARYNTDGSLDLSFAGDGIQSTGIGSSLDYATGVALRNGDGKIFIGGHADSGTGTGHDFAIASFDGASTSPDVILSSSIVAENQPAGTPVGTLTTSDPAGHPAYSYVLVAGPGSADNASFAIAGNSLRTAASFDFETKGVYSVRVRSTDQAGTVIEKPLLISVSDIADGTPDFLVTVPGPNLAAITGNAEASFATLSANGNVVAFTSRGTNFVSGDATDLYTDVFVRDLVTGMTEKVSVGPGGIQGNSESGLFSGSFQYPSLSADGRYVAFSSSAGNLAASDPNFTIDVFRYDRVTHTTQLVSSNAAGVVGNSDSYAPAISADGSKVVFRSRATNFVGGVPNNVFQIYVKDMTSGSISLVSTDSVGTIGNSDSDDPTLSANGQFAFFRSVASNLVTGDTNGVSDFFRKDLTTGAIVRVNVGSDGTTQAASGTSIDHIVASDDGRYAAFSMYSSNFGNGIFVKDLQTQQLRQITTGDSSLQSWGAAISGDGRYVSFGTSRSLLPEDTNNGTDYYRYDLSNNSLALLTVDSSGNQGKYTTGQTNLMGDTAISSDGQVVMFTSSQAFLDNPDTNNVADVFVRSFVTETTVAASFHGTGLTSSTGNGPDGFSGEYLTGQATSFDGRYAVFAGGRSDWVAGDTNGIQDILRRDRLANSTVRVNVDSLGLSATSPAYAPAISPDGRYVAFETRQSYDTRHTADLGIYVKDLLTGDIRLVSYPSSGPVQTTQSVDNPGISGVDASGSFCVIFHTYRSMSPEDTNGITDLYRWYSGDNRLELVTKDANGIVGNNYTRAPEMTSQISADGRYIVFSSYATNYVPNDTNGFADIFLKDMTTGAVTRLSLDAAGNQFSSDSTLPSISADGTTVVWSTFLSGSYVIYARNLQTGVLTIANSNAAGTRSTQSGFYSAVSGNGRYVAFTDSSNLTPGPWPASQVGLYIKDLQTGLVVRTNVRSGPTVDTALTSNWQFSFSGDGKTIFFRTSDTGFVANDFNGVPDMFARTWDLPATAVADSYWLRPNTTTSITAANGVLRNDIIPNGSALRAVLQTAPSSGTFLLNSDGSFTYTPVTNFEGQVSFSYWATDGLSYSEPVTVNILVERDNADLAVAVAATSAIAAAGEQVSYSVTVLDRGPLDAPGAVLTTQIPVNSTLVSATGIYTVTGNTLTWNLGTVPNGSRIVQYFTVQTTAAGPATAFARITGTLPDFDPGNNTSSDDAPSGLRNCWAAEGSTVDLAGGVATTLENGAGYVNRGYRDSGFSFDGVDDSVAVNSVNLGTAYTIEAWFYPTRSAGYEHLISNGYTSTNFGALYFRDNRLEYWQGGSSKVVTATNSVAMNTWTHVALTYDGSNTRIYINGTLAGTSVVHSAPFNNAMKFGYA
ncbi:MAG: PD40 domain-containing protein, partial [Planctomycetaceae bacterium]|nr:PD40 domain-containing protein [Planctomycetaceae bacterium]